MRKRKMAGAALLLVLGLAACNSGEEETQKQERVAAVELAEAAEGNLEFARTVFGRISALHTYPVMLSMAGEVDSLEAENGDMVEEDEVIARIATPAGLQTVRAPKEGEVAGLDVGESEMVSNEEPFAVIMDSKTIRVDFGVTAAVRSLMSLDQELAAVIDGKQYTATISKISNLQDETGMYPIAATIENKDGAVLPGMVAELSITEKETSGTVLIPTASIVEENGETYVYIVRDDKAHKQLVEVAASQTERSAVTGGVNPGDQLVVSGQLVLSDGARVNIVKGE